MLAIEANNVSKVYRIYQRPTDRLKELLYRRPMHREFWALKDINLRIHVGETFGVIGENGAGKSTLLKILTGATAPTTGDVRVRGKVAALLELGMGFHPEFTGRDNIYMSGTLMGMSRKEIDSKVNEIIEFSELGSFIDLPVKMYSSGMYVRLAFSVATAVDPDVLIIDEALAVGDQHFCKKCIDRIASIKRAGKTIVFCSHTMYYIKTLCERAIWLKEGRIESSGEAHKVVDDYMDYLRQKDGGAAEVDDLEPHAPPPRERNWLIGWIKRVEICDESGRPKDCFEHGETLKVKLWCGFKKEETRPAAAVVIARNDNVEIYGVSTEMDNVNMRHLGDDTYFISVSFPNLPLLPGKYHLNVAAMEGRQGLQLYEVWTRVCPFTVRYPGSREVGFCRLQHRWEHK